MPRKLILGETMRPSPNKTSATVFTILAILVWSVAISLLVPSCTYGDTNTVSLGEVFDAMDSHATPIPYAPIHIGGPPEPPESISNKVVVLKQYIYRVEYQTNAAHTVVTEYRTINVTNYVPRYPKLLYAQLKFTEDLMETNAWEEIGIPMAFKLGDTTNGFYTVQLRIE